MCSSLLQLNSIRHSLSPHHFLLSNSNPSDPRSLPTQMSTPHLRRLPIHQLKPYLLLLSTPPLPFPSATNHRFSLIQLHHRRRRPRVCTTVTPHHSRSFSVRAFDSDDTPAPVVKDGDVEAEAESGVERKSEEEDKYPTGEFRFREFGWWMTFLVKLRMLIAPPWKRIKKGSVLTMKLRGQITDQLRSSFSSGLSLPQICENFEKAAYDPRIAGIYIHVEPLNCGWAKVEEIRRHIYNFKQSGDYVIFSLSTNCLSDD